MVRFDCSIARLLDAGGWPRLRAGGWLRLSWAHLNSSGRFAGLFRKVAGWLRCFVWGLALSSLEESADSMLCLGSHTLEILRSLRIHGLKSPGGCCEASCALFQ